MIREDEKMKLLILNGANINMLGIREPEIYGKQSFAELLRMVKEHAEARGIEIECYQSNHEGDLVDAIQKAYFDKIDGIVFNPGGYTHTSVSIADAVKAVSIPTVEVHISEVDKREAFRQVSYIRSASVKTITGKGLQGYIEAMDYLIDNYNK